MMPCFIKRRQTEPLPMQDSVIYSVPGQVVCLWIGSSTPLSDLSSGKRYPRAVLFGKTFSLFPMDRRRSEGCRVKQRGIFERRRVLEPVI